MIRQQDVVGSHNSGISRVTLGEVAASERHNGAEEVLVLDGRCRRSPAEEVEERLFGLLRQDFVPMSHIRLRTVCQGRRHCGHS